MLFGKKLLDKYEFKYRRYAIKRLMTIIVFGMAFVYLAGLVPQGTGFFTNFIFSRDHIMRGQIWRLFSFVFFPPGARNEIFIIFVLYFYWWMGTTIERSWGEFKFNVFYLCGVLGTIIAGFISPLGLATNYYLNMSLLFAFALLYPEQEIRLFLILPIKIKFLGLLNAALFLFEFITTDSTGRFALVASLVNIVIFFGGDFMNMMKQAKRKADWKRKTGGWKW